jgi:hypothetical protein
MKHTIITLGPTEHGAKWDHNTHRVILKEETDVAFIGWPDATDPHCSSVWTTEMTPLAYPKFAWERKTP